MSQTNEQPCHTGILLSTQILDHICHELNEIETAPLDLEKWINVALLALNGARRAGHSPEEIAVALACKQDQSETSEWSNWRTISRNHL